jgi:hypothetical protein
MVTCKSWSGTFSTTDQILFSYFGKVSNYKNLRKNYLVKQDPAKLTLTLGYPQVYIVLSERALSPFTKN